MSRRDRSNSSSKQPPAQQRAGVSCSCGFLKKDLSNGSTASVCTKCNSKFSSKQQKWIVTSTGRQLKRSRTRNAPASHDPFVNLGDVRIWQPKLIFIGRLPLKYCNETTLREWFGKFGRITKVSCNPKQDSLHHQAFVQFSSESQAQRAIRSVNGCDVGDGCNICVTMGTTKYCLNFLNEKPCSGSNCLFLHDWDDNIVSKDELFDCLGRPSEMTGLPFRAPRRSSTRVSIQTAKMGKTSSEKKPAWGSDNPLISSKPLDTSPVMNSVGESQPSSFEESEEVASSNHDSDGLSRGYTSNSDSSTICAESEESVIPRSTSPEPSMLDDPDESTDEMTVIFPQPLTVSKSTDAAYPNKDPQLKPKRYMYSTNPDTFERVDAPLPLSAEMNQKLAQIISKKQIDCLSTAGRHPDLLDLDHDFPEEPSCPVKHFGKDLVRQAQGLSEKYDGQMMRPWRGPSLGTPSFLPPMSMPKPHGFCSPKHEQPQYLTDNLPRETLHELLMAQEDEIRRQRAEEQKVPEHVAHEIERDPSDSMDMNACHPSRSLDCWFSPQNIYEDGQRIVDTMMKVLAASSCINEQVEESRFTFGRSDSS